MTTFPKWRTGRIFDLDTQDNFLIIIKTTNYNDSFTCSIPFVKAFHKNVQSVHKGFTV